MAERPTGESGPGPYEPLYRAGEPTERTDPGWGRHSHPEHDPRDSPVGDRYAWLFRDDDPAPAHAAAAPDDEEDTSPRLNAVPPPAPPIAPPPTPVPDDEPERRRRGPVVVLVVVLVLALAVAGMLIGRWWLAPRPRDATPPASSSAPSSAAALPTSGTSQGSTSPVVPTAVSADCTAPDATDDAGAKVSYAAAQTTDDDPATAWRCNGSGVGKTLTLTLPGGTTVTELGLINGYAKTDPKSGKDRYGEYRRITAVTWTVGDQQVQQKLDDSDEELQTVTVDPTESDRVVLTIESSSDPGSDAKTRDAVLISEVQVSASS